MNKYSMLHTIQHLYNDSHVNISQYLKGLEHEKQNCIEDIMISYDFQAGAYVDAYMTNEEIRERKRKLVSRLVRIWKELPGRKQTVFEPGVGEATTLVPFVNALGSSVCWGGGDISWSRIKFAQKFAKEYLNQKLAPLPLVMADMFSLPLADESVDVVYTSHAMEPNGGHEKEIMKELYRVANEYLILLEPAYELAGQEAKERMQRYGYVRDLYQTAKALGYDVLTWELLEEFRTSLNPTGLMIIRKHPSKEAPQDLEFACPVTKAKLKLLGNAYYSEDSLLAYPIINSVPCLISDCAVVATKLAEFA